MAVFLAFGKTFSGDAAAVIFSFLEDSSQVPHCGTDVADLDDLEPVLPEQEAHNRGISHWLYRGSLDDPEQL